MPQVTLPVAGVAYNVNSSLGHDGIVGVKTGFGSVRLSLTRGAVTPAILDPAACHSVSQGTLPQFSDDDLARSSSGMLLISTSADLCRGAVPLKRRRNQCPIECCLCRCSTSR
jgi:hypothetical protein